MASEGSHLQSEMDVQDDEPPTDAMLPSTATAPFDAREAAPNLEGASETERIQDLTVKLGNLGIDASILPQDLADNSWCPQQGDVDYRQNHRSLLKFFGIHLTRRTQDSDVQHRFRLRAQVVHPDQLGLDPGAHLLAYARQVFQSLEIACRELMMRAEWVGRRHIDPPNLEDSFPYQEVHENFQSWFQDHFKLDDFITNTSELFFWNLGSQPGWKPVQQAGRLLSPPCDRACTFLELLLYGRSDDDELLELMLQTFGRSLAGVKELGRPWRVGILLQKTPPTLQKWLDDQLAKIRAAELNLTLYFVILADSWPAPWHRAKVYFEPHLVRSNSLPAYRVQTHYIDPAVMTVITAGMGAMKQLKKTLVVQLSTGRLPTLASHEQRPVEFLDWRPLIVPTFRSSKRLLIDFAPSDLVEVVGAFAQVALKTRGVRSQHTARSFGDSPGMKRRTLVISYGVDFDTENDALWQCVADTIARHEFQILVGFELLFTVPAECIIIDSENLDWLHHSFLKECLSQGVVVSCGNVISTLAGAATSTILADKILVWNDDHPTAKVTNLRDQHGRSFWSHSGDRGSSSGPPRPKGAPAPAPEDFTFILEGAEERRTVELAGVFLGGVKQMLARQGHNLEHMQTTIWHNRGRGGPRGRILVTGWHMVPLRSLLYGFRNYTWQGDDGVPLIVRIQNQHIDDELTHSGALRMFALKPTLLNCQESCYVHVNRQPPPLAIAPP